MTDEEKKKYINSPKFVEDMADNLFASLGNICATRTIMEKVGQAAMDYISDYPLYCSGTDNITYVEAIMIAIASGKSYQELLDEAGVKYTPYQP